MAKNTTKKTKETKKEAKPAKKSTGRPCSVCTHPDVSAINSAILNEESFRSIASRFGMSDVSVHRHVQRHLKLDISALKKEKRLEQVIDHYQEITEQLEFAKELRIASREYLTDPDNPGKIALLPRADEVDLVYLDHKDCAEVNGKPVPKRKKAKLDQILEEIFVEGSKEADKWSIKHVDIRSFALDAIKTVDLVLDKVAKVEGIYQQERKNQSDLQAVVDEIRDYLREYPDHPRDEVIRTFALKAKLDVQTVSEMIQ